MEEAIRIAKKEGLGISVILDDVQRYLLLFILCTQFLLSLSNHLPNKIIFGGLPFRLHETEGGMHTSAYIS